MSAKIHKTRRSPVASMQGPQKLILADGRDPSKTTETVTVYIVQAHSPSRTLSWFYLYLCAGSINRIFYYMCRKWSF